ncbi:MAG: S41 family peptidase [Cyanothece sp. SIO1E1]|nr:S41 family peptidase [Cyanothece sp. SIO1E1]
MKTYYFLLISLLSFSCTDLLFEEEPTNDPVGNFESLWNTFHTRYAVFEQRQVDWQELYQQYRPLVNDQTTDQELFDIITAMLTHLDDAHVSLMADGQPFWRGFREFRERTKDSLFNLWMIPNNYVAGNFVNVNDQFFYGKIQGDIGYLFVRHLSDDPAGFIDPFIAEMQDMEGMVIDLRHNGGGDFTNGELIASRFASQRALAFSGQPKNGPGPNDYAHTTDYYLEPDGPIRFTKPVIVLTDIYTVSAGENLVLYLREQPHITVIGDRTTGAMGERIEKEMPNGWVYSITGQIMTAADGNIYEGPGIPPDEFILNTREEMEQGIDRTLEKAIEKIRE